MKRSLLFLLLIVCYSYTRDVGDKIALIVAIGQYQEGSGWETLGSLNDSEMIRSALIRQGFKEKNIFLLKNEAATKEGIIQAFRKRLIQQAVKGGTAIFHFSGHGQQILDNNGDELDNYDEALVPYDSSIRYQEGIYEGENLLRDEDLGALLLQLRKRLGKKGQLLCLIDACHSGTGTRGWGPARGTNIKMAPPKSWKSDSINLKEKNNLIQESPQISDIAPMIAFFASSAGQLNYEARNDLGQSCGPLSYAFSKSFIASSKESTYQELFESIQLEMAATSPRQTPQAEGDLDQIIFGGKIRKTTNYYRVLHSFGKVLIIDGGLLSGMSANTQVVLYPADTQDTSQAKVLARGIVQYPELTSSEVHLDRALPRKKALSSKVFVENLNFGFLSLRLKLDISEIGLHSKIHEKLKDTTIIEIVNSDPDLYLRQKEDRLNLTSKEGHLILDTGLAWHPEILNKIQQYIQARFLRNLALESPLLHLEMEIIPLEETQLNGTTQLLSSALGSKRGADGVLRFSEGDPFQIRITNKGLKPAYFSLLDIQPDHQINVLLPETDLGRVTEEYYLLPDQQKVFPEKSEEFEDFWTFGSPYGVEVFKLVATEYPINLHRAIQTRGEVEVGSNPHPLEMLLSADFLRTQKTRGSSSLAIAPGETQISSLIFQVEE